jgi:hypothetical protein
MDTTTITGTTTSFAEGKALSSELRAATPEAMQRVTAELQRVAASKRDYVIGTPALRMRPGDDKGVVFDFPNPGLFGALETVDVGRIAHEQLAEKTGIPLPYYRRCLGDAPALLTHNVEHWFQAQPKNVLVRVLDGRLRAVLSDGYRVLDNADFFFRVGKSAIDAGAVIQRLDLSDERFYLRALRPDFAAKITGRGDALKAEGKMFSSGYRSDNGTWQGPDADDPHGDWIFPGFVASNSEVGRGGLNVELSMFRSTCSNYILTSQAVHKIHRGDRMNEGILDLADDTRRAKDDALWLEIRDMVAAAFDEDAWRKLVAKANQAQADVLEAPVEAVDAVAKDGGLSDEDKQAVLNELIAPSRGLNVGATRWGLVNAVTSLQHTKSIERSVEIERLGAAILEDRELVAVRK